MLVQTSTENGIGAEGARDLAEALMENTTLTGLNIRGTYVGTASL